MYHECSCLENCAADSQHLLTSSVDLNFSVYMFADDVISGHIPRSLSPLGCQHMLANSCTVQWAWAFSNR